jgi:hypothetical protein
MHTRRKPSGPSTLAIRHPDFLDGEADLFGANPFRDVRKTIVIKEFSVTVWSAEPVVRPGR